MRTEHLGLLACPRCQGELELTTTEREGDHVLSGELRCRCGERFPIVRGVPSFVAGEGYARSFGYQWTRHARTQFDSASGVPVSETRFFETTRWPRRLEGETLLEVGCGSGRFTEQAANTGATVVALDLSAAAFANFEVHGDRANVLVVQGDILALPVRHGAFTRVLCLGMLQHTPDPGRAFAALPPCLAPGGHIAIDVYRRQPWFKYLWMTRYWVRPVTRRLSAERLYRLVSRYVRVLWPLARLVNRLPRGRSLNRLLLLSDYRGLYPLSEEHLLEWCILDTFDYLSAYHDHPQRLEAVRRWFEGCHGLEAVEVEYGHNGIVGRARRCVVNSSA